MTKRFNIKLAALGALLFGATFSMGATALTGCWGCHATCDANRAACVANGGPACQANWRLCTSVCAASYPNCDIP